MQWRNTLESYGAVAKSFHWVIALAVIGLIGVGLYMAAMDPSPVKFQLSFWHKSIGVTVLALAVLRLGWRLTNAHPAALPGHAGWERGLARVTHGLLYLSLFLMPLSGWIMSSAKGFSVSVFGLFTLPDLVGESDAIGAAARNIHGLAGYALIGLIGLHAAGAVKHHVIDRDSTLRRMLPAFLVLIALAAANPARADAGWTIVKDQSTLGVSGTQMGAPFKGGFSAFDGTIVFDPAAPEAGRADITIDLASFASGSKDRDQSVQGDEWFAAKKFPQARFVAGKFSKGEADGAWIAHGNLTIRDVTVPLDLPFMLSIAPGPDGSDVAHAVGTVVLNRLDYGVGAGEWADPKSVGTDVTVTVDLTARRAAP